jgi:AcrR family transcriptional regulator
MGIVNIIFGAAMTNAESISSDPRPYHHGDLRRALIDAALDLVTEEQDWSFSLRNVARRARVSHNAPYNHFADKGELLAAVAAEGFEALRARLLSATAGIEAPGAALAAAALAYVRHGVENPALYRLMFGPALATPSGDRPADARSAGAKARAVLEEIILRGARLGAFAISPDDGSELDMAALSAWSAVHGMTMLVIDDLPGTRLPLDQLVGGLMRVLGRGLAPR